MRVIAGTHRGRRLHGPREQLLRPTSDRVREALFSILGNRLTHGRFLDLYAGTGAVGIEAISRGAEHVTFVESNKEALKLLQRNLQLCRLTHEVTVRPQLVERFYRQPEQWNGPYDIVFADPPYTETTSFSTLFDEPAIDALFAIDAWLIVEHAAKVFVPETLGITRLRRQYRYGDTALSVYSRPESESI